MFDSVVSSGCSMAWGDELKDRTQRFSSIIAQQENAKLFDFSGKGYSNEAITLNFINGVIGLIKTQQIIPEKTLALVNFTFATRLAYFSSEAKGWLSTFRHRAILDEARYHNRYGFDEGCMFYKYYHPQEIKLFYDDHTHPLFLLYNTCSKMHRIETFLRLHNIKFVYTFGCIDTLKLVNDGVKDLDILLKGGYEIEGFTNFKCLLQDIDYTKIFQKAFENFALSNKYPIGPGRHPLEKAHVEYAKLLRKFIDEKFVPTNNDIH